MEQKRKKRKYNKIKLAAAGINIIIILCYLFQKIDHQTLENNINIWRLYIGGYFLLFINHIIIFTHNKEAKKNDD